jgi:hypothetical protein
MGLTWSIYLSYDLTDFEVFETMKQICIGYYLQEPPEVAEKAQQLHYLLLNNHLNKKPGIWPPEGRVRWPHIMHTREESSNVTLPDTFLKAEDFEVQQGNEIFPELEGQLLIFYQSSSQNISVERLPMPGI